MVVDDWIPFDPEQDLPAFSKSHREELWVILLEKAWAKINGSYENSRYGNSGNAFVFLTGAPCKFYDHELIEDFWDELMKSYKL